jgi:hypothetical protein
MSTIQGQLFRLLRKLFKHTVWPSNVILRQVELEGYYEVKVKLKWTQGFELRNLGNTTRKSG